MNKVRRLVIIGCAGTGGPAAMMAKKLAPDLDVTVIREEEHFLTRCALPYIVVSEATVSDSVNDEKLSHADINLVDVKATEIDRAAKTVTVADGRTFPYDKLLLATGGEPVVPPIPGIDQEGIHTVRTVRDAAIIQEELAHRGIDHVTVVGAGAVGLEMAVLLREHGARVEVVEMLDHVLPLALDAEMAEEVETHLQEEGLTLRMTEKASRFLGDGRVTGVELASGRSFATGMVIMAGGVRARTELAKAAGLEVGRFGVKVNKYLQTSDPDIYAGGDLIEYPDFVTGKTTVGQLRPNAVVSGRTVIKNILGYPLEFPGFLNNFATKLGDLSVSAVGVTETRAAHDALPVVAAIHRCRSRHRMIAGGRPLSMKLVFSRDTKQLVGGQIVSYSDVFAKEIDAITLAIRGRLTAWDLVTFRGAGQPELSPEPSAEPITSAAESVFPKLYEPVPGG